MKKALALVAVPFSVLCLACEVPAVDERSTAHPSPVEWRSDEVRNGTASADPTVGTFTSPGFASYCTGTTICARQKKTVAADGSVTYRNYAAVLTAAHCNATLSAYTVPLPQQLATEAHWIVNLSPFTADQFRIVRAVSAPAASLQQLPVRPIANAIGDLPGDRIITGYGGSLSDFDYGVQRTGTVVNNATEQSADLLVSSPGGADQMLCKGDSGGPMFLNGLITGTAYAVRTSGDGGVCLTATQGLHMNTAKYRPAIEAAALELVPECNEFDSETCPFSYKYGANPPAECALPGTMGNWRYASKGFPYVTNLTFKPYCEGIINANGEVNTTAVNRSYVGVTWAGSTNSTSPAMCSCKACGYVRATVTAGGLQYVPGQACGGGCGLPVLADVPYMTISVTNRVLVPPITMPPPQGMPLVEDDFNPSKRSEITVACVPVDANCLVQNRP